MGKVKAAKPETGVKDKPKKLKKISKPPKVKLASKAVKQALKNEVTKKELIQKATPKDLKEVVKEKVKSPKKGKKEQKKGKKLVKVVPQKVNVVKKKVVKVNPFINLLDKSTVESGVKALFKLKEQKTDKNELFEEEQPIYIQISTIKVPNCPPKILRLSLPNTTLTDDSEICLITQNIKDDVKNYDKNIEKYEAILESKGVTNIKKIIPLHQLYSEYSVYEMQHRLVELYDHFLVDGKACGKAIKTFGGMLNRKNKSPTIIKLNVSNLKGMIDSKLSMVQFAVHSNGDNFTVKVGHMKMEEDKVVENIFGLVEELNKKFPGGFKNVKALHIKNPLGTSIPVYLNLIKNSSVKVPVIKPNRPKAFQEVTDELSTVTDGTVTVLPTGTVLLNKEGENIEQFNKRNKKKLNKMLPEETALVAKFKKQSGIALPKKIFKKKAKKGKGKMKKGIAEKILDGVAKVAEENKVDKKKKQKRKMEEDKTSVVEVTGKKSKKGVTKKVEKKTSLPVEEEKAAQVGKNKVIKEKKVKAKKNQVGVVEEKKVEVQDKKEGKTKKAEVKVKKDNKIKNKKAKLEEKVKEKKAILEEKVKKGKKVKEEKAVVNPKEKQLIEKEVTEKKVKKVTKKVSKADNSPIKSKTEVTKVKKTGKSKKVK